MATFYRIGIARSGNLPAAGAYDTNPKTLECNTFKEISFLIRYTRGGGGGAITYKVEFSNDQVNWYQTAQFQAPAVVAGSDSIFLSQRNEIKYQATSANTEDFMTPTYTVPSQFVRISAKESGTPLTPGSANIEFQFRGDQT